MPSTSRSDSLPNMLDPSTPNSHAANVLDEREPHNIVERHDKDQNEPISRRCGTRRPLSPIIVPQTAMPPPLPQARERAQVRRSSNNVHAAPIHRTSSAAIERVLPISTTDHTLLANRLVAHRSKRRRLGSDVITASQPEPEVHPPPISNPTRNSACPCPKVSDEGGNNRAVGIVPPDIVSKISRVGSVELLEELRGNLFCLRAGVRRKPLTPNHETRALCIRDSFEEHRSGEVARVLSNLRDELEVAEMGEQLCRFRKRVALSRFYDFYEMAQEYPSYFLS